LREERRPERKEGGKSIEEKERESRGGETPR
jgi:hypothetical protein